MDGTGSSSPMTAKTLLVGGFFDDGGGKPSRALVPVLHEALASKGGSTMTFLNGGHFSELERELERIHEYGVIYWFANVSNNKPKIVGDIKKHHKRCLLVTSKRNDGDKYSLSDIIYHALNLKSNLVVEFKKDVASGTTVGRVLDPLANVFLDFTADFTLIGKALAKRVGELQGFTRVGSTSVSLVPDRPGFFSLIRRYADVFHDLIHSVSTERFMPSMMSAFAYRRGQPSAS